MDMIVYGDPSFEQSVGTLLKRLRSRVKSLLRPIVHSRGTAAREVPTDGLRALLIQAGQVEQGFHDFLMEGHLSGDHRAIMTRLEQLTDCAARAFMAHLGYASIDAGPLSLLTAALFKMDEVLNAIDSPPAARLTAKVPEGFAFYTLYPEQYCTAALRWLADRPESGRRPALVVGIRSIGTTLSAVVSATLNLNGQAAHRITVRPTGHPFSRKADIPREALQDAGCALIVDEGPGLSGSSMAAAAQALVDLGLDRRRIYFLPGHDREPGQAASEEVRAWWAGTRRYVTPLSEHRWDGCSLEERFTFVTPDLLRGKAYVKHVEDFSGGLWRAAVYRDQSQWPAVCARFEAAKYRCVLDNGRSILWKFTGLATGPHGQDLAEAALARLKARAAAGWTAAPLGTSQGFVAMPWIEGEALSRDDADPARLAHIGRYIADVAGAPMSIQEQQAALKRLQEMLYWNVWESMGEEAVNRTRSLSEKAAGLVPGKPAPSYGDGRLAPHEWRRTPSGRILKTDAAGHELDHTVVRRQPIAWDLAGAIVEWGLEGEAATALLKAAEAAGAELPPAALLAFYRAAYAAFRVGQCVMCMQSATDVEERARLAKAVEFYKAALPI